MGVRGAAGERRRRAAAVTRLNAARPTGVFKGGPGHGTVDVDLADGVGWVQADGARSVEFLGRDGSSLGTAKGKQPDRSATLGPVVTG